MQSIDHDKTATQAELERILPSRCFRSRSTLRKFLTYIVQETLAGRQASLTQYTIATKGLGKPADFDATENPLIRVYAGRLRAQLDEYYTSEGRFNPIRISLLPGNYCPEFLTQRPLPLLVQENSNPSQSQGSNIVCIPRSFLSCESEGWPLITSITRDYSTHLTRFNLCQILFADEDYARHRPWPDKAWEHYQADFALFFDLYQNNGTYKLKCSLAHSLTRQIVWAEGFSLGAGSPEEATLHRIFKRIAHDTVSFDGGLAHAFFAHHLLDSGKPIAPQHQVIVTLLQQIWKMTPAAFHTLRLTCEKRLDAYPEDVQALIVYASLHRTDYLLKYQEFESLQDSQRQVTEALLRLAPHNAYSHYTFMIACIMADDQEMARSALQTMLELNPLDTYLEFNAGLAYLSFDEWETGIELIQSIIDLTPLHADWTYIPIAINHYRNGRYLAALKEAQKIRFQNFWGPALRTDLYHRTGKLQEATAEFRRMTSDYPEVVTQGKSIIAQGFTPQGNQLISKIWSDAASKQ